MRRIPTLAVAVTATTMLALTACGGGGGFSSGSATQNTKTGPVKLTVMIGSSGDAETSGIYKVADPREWRRACMQNRGVFAGLNLPLGKVHAVDQGPVAMHEVNTHLDYLALLRSLTKR
jgi:multiple sugar transport system substrate-binding protein